MIFSKTCEYGIRAVIYITVQSQQDQRVSLKEIAREIGSPEAFTAKILQQLARNGVIDSIKGPSGGFNVDKSKMETIKLIHIVKAIDGDGFLKSCGLGLKECSAKQPCPVHHQFKHIREALRNMLETTTLLNLAEGMNIGSVFLKV